MMFETLFFKILVTLVLSRPFGNSTTPNVMSTGMAFDWLSMTFFNHCLIKVLGLLHSFSTILPVLCTVYLTAFLLANHNGEFTSCILSRMLVRAYLVFGKM